MKYLIVLLTTLVAAEALATPGFRNFNGYKVYRLKVEDNDQYEDLKKLHVESELDFWTEPKINGFTDVMVNDEQASTLFKVVNASNIETSVLIPDIHRLISEQRGNMRRSANKEMDFTSYYNYDAIVAYTKDLAASYPDMVTVKKIGTSTENRDINVVKISTGGEGKEIVFIDGMYHSREWISSAFVTYIIDQLVKNYSENKEVLQRFDFHFVPIVNPDGYEYSSKSDRLWRKTRSGTTNPKCRGVDPNRNFGHKYGGSGTSDNPCSEIFKGANAFSEPETRAIRDYILSLSNLKTYITCHSYGQYWLTPWGYTSEVPEDYPELVRVANIGADKIREPNGSNYTVGSSTNVLYAAAGGSDDWAKGAGGATYSFTIELRDTGRYGFLLPASQITPTCEETWPGVKAALLATV